MYRYLVLLALNIRARLARAQPGVYVPAYFRPLTWIKAHNLKLFWSGWGRIRGRQALRWAGCGDVAMGTTSTPDQARHLMPRESVITFSRPWDASFIQDQKP